MQLALHGSRTLNFDDGETNLNVTNQLHVIPGTEGDVSIGTYYPFHAPLYWQLPHDFMRDKVHPVFCINKVILNPLAHGSFLNIQEVDPLSYFL